MFKSAVIKLTLFYLAVVMAISVCFSVVVYRLAGGEFNRGFQRQERAFINRNNSFYEPNGQLQSPPPPPPNGFRELRQQELHESLQHTRAYLVVVNAVVLLLGGGLSYLFALWTLRPIARAHEAQVRFTADASHELRTPLAVMRSEIEVALREKTLTDRAARAQLTSNLEEVTRLESLSVALLALSRYEGGSSQAFELVHIADVVKTAVANSAGAAKQRHINIKASGSDVTMYAQSDSLVQLVTVLLDNAIKYSEPRSEVEVAWKQQADQVVIQVIDHGLGIAPDQVGKIFQRFYRADTARSQQTASGYGLGLSIAEEIVQMHAGRIEVASSVGEGSTFTVLLPQQRASKSSVQDFLSRLPFTKNAK